MAARLQALYDDEEARGRLAAVGNRDFHAPMIPSGASSFDGNSSAASCDQDAVAPDHGFWEELDVECLAPAFAGRFEEPSHAARRPSDIAVDLREDDVDMTDGDDEAEFMDAEEGTDATFATLVPLLGGSGDAVAPPTADNTGEGSLPVASSVGEGDADFAALASHTGLAADASGMLSRTRCLCT